MFKSGNPRLPNSGRKVGTANKRTLELDARLIELGEDVPERVSECLRELAALQDRGDDSDLFDGPQTPLSYSEKLNTIKAKADIYLELMQYLFPKRKAIEHTGVPEVRKPLDLSKLSKEEVSILEKALFEESPEPTDL